MATRAHGVVTRVELLEAGVTVAEVKQRLSTGALIRVHRGVYRVGHRAPSPEASYLAAVRACGEKAVLSGLAAAWLLGLVKGRPPAPDVTAATERRIEGVRTRRSRRRDRTPLMWRGVPVTMVAQTLVDIAPDLTVDELALACHEAGVRFHTTPADVEALLVRQEATPGAGKLRRVLHGEVQVTLSKLERRFLARLREAGLPLPITNRPAGGRRVDCRWPAHRLTVELDSYRYHASRHAWERDHRRAREAYARNDDFRRYNYTDVVEQPRLMMRELRDLLSTQRPA